MKEKKKRVNFTVEERQLLIKLVEKFKQTVENKRTNGVTPKEKDQAWEKLSFEFNSEGVNIFRSKDQLKKFWANVKQTERANAAEEKKSIFKTGGGSGLSQNPPDETVLSIINLKTVVGLENEYDDNNSFKSDRDIRNIIDQSIYNCLIKNIILIYFWLVLDIREENMEEKKKMDVASSSTISDIITSRPGTISSKPSKAKLIREPSAPKSAKNKPEGGEIEELKKNYLSLQVEEIKERVEMRRQEKNHQAIMQKIDVKKKEVELLILQEEQRRVKLQNELLELEVASKRQKLF